MILTPTLLSVDRKYYRKFKLNNGKTIKLNQCVAVSTEDDQTFETAETARVLALWVDTKGKKKGKPFFKGRWLFEPQHLPPGHPEQTRARTKAEKKEWFEAVDDNCCDDNELVRVCNPIGSSVVLRSIIVGLSECPT